LQEYLRAAWEAIAEEKDRKTAENTAEPNFNLEALKPGAGFHIYGNETPYYPARERKASRGHAKPPKPIPRFDQSVVSLFLLLLLPA